MNQNQQKREEIKFAFDVLPDGKIKPMQLVKSTVVPEIPARVYRLDATPELGLHLVPENDFQLPKRIYGKVNNHAQRFLRSYELNDKNLGVLLIGDPGSGKTLTLKQVAMLSVEMQYPVILIDQAIPGQMLAPFLGAITQPCVVCFDEFDKNYAAKMENQNPNTPPGQEQNRPNEAQNSILSLLDGATTGHKKLYVFTANDDNAISVYLKDRPSRIRYTIRYNRIEKETVVDYVRENLHGCTDDAVHAFVMLAVADRGNNNGMNFDSLVELVKEMNQFKCSLDEALELMLRNGKRVYTSFEVTVFENDVKKQLVMGLGSHNGVYMATGDYTIDMRITEPSQEEPGWFDRVKYTLTQDDFVGLGDDCTMYEFKKGKYTFFLRQVDINTAHTADHEADMEFTNIPVVKERMEKARQESEAGGGNNLASLHRRPYGGYGGGYDRPQPGAFDPNSPFQPVPRQLKTY